MSTVIDTIERDQLRRVPRFQPGDRLKVHFQVIEGSRRRTQVFEGVAIKRQGHGVRETFTVRKQSFGVGVERTFPLHSPKIEKIEVAARGDVRRAKLYYLRDRVGKAGGIAAAAGRRGFPARARRVASPCPGGTHNGVMHGWLGFPRPVRYAILLLAGALVSKLYTDPLLFNVDGDGLAGDGHVYSPMCSEPNWAGTNFTT